MTKWLKVIGTSSQPFRRHWTTEAPHLRHTATFSQRCAWEPGDEFVYHAIGVDGSRVVAIGEVLSSCRHQPDVDPGFEFACDVAIKTERAPISEGVLLDELNVPGARDLRRSVGRHSHIELTEDEFERAKRALTA
jgi:hypothetical protein